MKCYNSIDILEAREKRSNMQEYLLKKYNNTIICLRVNYPGTNKNSKLCKNISCSIEKIINDMFGCSINYKFLKYTAEGRVVIFILKLDAMRVKKIAVEIEEKHILGRCVDIDVYDPSTLRCISRTELNLPKRKCYLCQEDAHVCVRNQQHTASEIINYMENCYKKYMENFYDNQE